MDVHEMSREDMLHIVAGARNKAFADLVVLMVGLAAETHPEELRRAIGKVFDLTAVEEQNKRMLLTQARTQADVNQSSIEMKHAYESLKRKAEDLEKRLEAANEYITQLARQVSPSRKAS